MDAVRVVALKNRVSAATFAVRAGLKKLQVVRLPMIAVSFPARGILSFELTRVFGNDIYSLSGFSAKKSTHEPGVSDDERGLEKVHSRRHGLHARVQKSSRGGLHQSYSFSTAWQANSRIYNILGWRLRWNENGSVAKKELLQPSIAYTRVA